MNTSDPENIKEEGLLGLVPLMAPADRGAVVLFNSWSWALGFLTSDSQALTAMINAAAASSNSSLTDIQQALYVAAALFTDPERRRVIWLLTDGNATGGNPAAASDALEAEGITIVTMGLGPMVNVQKLEQIATDGVVYTIHSAADIPAAYDDAWTILGFQSWLECGPDGWEEVEGSCD